MGECYTQYFVLFSMVNIQSTACLSNFNVFLACRLGETSAHIVPECPQFFFIGIGFIKDSIYKVVFDDKIQRFQEAGLIGKWTRDGLERAGKLAATKDKITQTQKLSLTEMQGVFMMLGCLYIPAALAFGVELALGGSRPKQRRRKPSKRIENMKLGF